MSIPIYGTGGSASISSSKSQTDANYQSVSQQSGLFAGSGGYDIKVKGNTDLQGAVIDSTASADKNQLTTASLTHGDIQNSMSASSSTSGTTLGSGMFSGNYAAAKGIAGNLLDRGAASASDASTAKSAIAQGTLTLTGAQPSTDISRDTSNTNRALAKPDIAGLQNAAQGQRADGNLLFATATAVSDPINRAMTADKKIVLQKCDGPGGTNCTQTQVDASQVKAGSDGKIYVFNNGIMNNEADAESNAAKQSGDTANKQGVYVIINPYTGNAVSEVLYAGVDKLNELTGGKLPISNASQANIDLRNQANAVGGTVIEVDHSRGTLTSSNATATQVNSGQNNVPLGSVTFNGGAANAQRAANLLQTATQNAPGGPGIQLQATHVDDPVGNYIGGNNPTGGVPGTGIGSHSSYSGDQVLTSPINADAISDNKKYWGPGNSSIPQRVRPATVLLNDVLVPATLNSSPSASITNNSQADDTQRHLQQQIGTTPVPVPTQITVPTIPSAGSSSDVRVQQLNQLKQQLLQGQ